jgi:hypothetical protein
MHLDSLLEPVIPCPVLPAGCLESADEVPGRDGFKGRTVTGPNDDWMLSGLALTRHGVIPIGEKRVECSDQQERLVEHQMMARLRNFDDRIDTA